tara:strand:- start:156 stop:503 length:348 start_codon:yes stop_codon:yes gene_type:complete
MYSSKKTNSKFVDDFMIFFDAKLETTPIKDIVIKHINIKEYEKQEKRKKEALDNPPKKQWKRNKNIYNIDILCYFQKNYQNKKIKEKKINTNCNSSTNTYNKIYSNCKRSVMYKT